MKMSLETFSCIPNILIPIFTSPITYDDNCLLTCEKCSDLMHAVRASDGRVYDAYSLHSFARVHKGVCVIPDCPIHHVIAIPFVSHIAHMFWKRAQVRLFQLSELMKTTNAHTATRKQSLFMRVIEENKRKRVHLSFRGERRELKRSATSAFTCLEKNKRMKLK